MSTAHPSEAQWTALAVGELAADVVERLLSHATTCAECSRRLDLLSDLAWLAAPHAPSPPTSIAQDLAVAAADEPLPRADARKPLIARVLPWVLLFAIVAVLVRHFTDPGDRFARVLELRVPPYDAATARASEQAEVRELAAAMTGWNERDFARVERALQSFLDAHEDHAEANLWLGIALRELGRAEDAERALRTAVAKAEPEALQRHAQWELALVFVLLRRTAEALGLLDEVSRADDEWGVSARALAQRLRSLQ